MQCDIPHAGRMKRLELRLQILTPIHPQAVKTLPLAGRSSGSLLPRRLPDFWSVAMSAANVQPRIGWSLQQRELHRSFTCFPFNPSNPGGRDET